MIPPHAFCTPSTIHKCAVCVFSFGDPRAPEGQQEWCRMELNTETCEGPKQISPEATFSLQEEET